MWVGKPPMKHYGQVKSDLLTSESAFTALNISMATRTDKDRVDAFALPYVK